MKRILVLCLAAAMLFGAMAACRDPDAGDTGRFLATNTPAPTAPPEDQWVPDDPLAGIEGIHVLPVVGSDFAAGILIEDLDADQINVTTMMSIDWDYIVSLQNTQPFHQYEATMAWRETLGGNVSIRTVPENEMTTSLMAWTAGGEAPDIIPGNNANFPLWSKNNLTADMKWYADNMVLYNSAIYNKDLMEAYGWRNEYPWAITNEAVMKYYIVYNKNLFDEAGVKTPWDHHREGNWTWTQFVRTAREMTVGDEQYGFTGWGLFPYQSPYAMASLDAGGNVVLNVDDTNYMRYMTEVYNFYQTENAGRLGWSLQDWGTLFPTGIDAMVITNLSSFARMSRTAARRQTGADLRVAPLFRFDPNDESEPISPTSVWGYSISRAAKAPIGAANYIRLESLVGQNILATYGFDWHDFVNAEERAMIDDFEANGRSVVEVILGVGDCYLGILDALLVPSIYYGPSEVSVQGAFDAVRHLLEAEVAAFNARD
jgi:hypothetical protein